MKERNVFRLIFNARRRWRWRVEQREVASMLLQHIIAEAKQRGYRQLSLETGSMAYFEPARSLYRKSGFKECAVFIGYKLDPNSTFFTREI